MTTKRQWAIIGFGNQARAWAANLKESGDQVNLYLREKNAAFEKAQAEGFAPRLLNDPALKNESVIALLIPDHTHEDFFRAHQTNISSKTKIIVAHGYTVAFEKLDQKFSQFSFILLAPKGIASELRRRKIHGLNVGAVWSKKESPNEEQMVADLARNLGITHLYASTFAEEAKADLFSEQALLCGVVPYAAQKSFQLLIDQGISKEVAFMECWMELQLITTALVEKGPEAFFQMISPNALLGSKLAQDLIFDEKYDAMLKTLWEDIENGRFQKLAQDTSFSELQQTIVQEWQKSDLQKTYHQLKSIL